MYFRFLSGRTLVIIGVGFLMLVVAIITASRDFSIGTDTENYISFFMSVIEGGETKQKPIMTLFAQLVKVFSADPRIYLGLLSLMFAFIYMRAVREAVVSYRLTANEFLVVIGGVLAFLFWSNWYVVASINGLRQGLSEAFLYLSIMFFLQHKYWMFSVFFAVAVLTHFAMLLVLPFIWLLKLKDNSCFVIVLSTAIAYLLGLNELVVSLLSSIFGLGVYESILDYGSGSGLWLGLQWDHFLYSIFWLFVFIFFRRYIQNRFKDTYLNIVKVYAFLLMPYFVFGFGGFSNRYAFIAWLFIPFVQGLCFSMCKLNLQFKLMVLPIIGAMGLIKFLSYVG